MDYEKKNPSPERCVNHHNNGSEVHENIVIYHGGDRCNHPLYGVYLVKHSAGVVTPNKNGTHFERERARVHAVFDDPFISNANISRLYNPLASFSFLFRFS